MQTLKLSWGMIPLLVAALFAGCKSTPPAPTQAQITDEVAVEATVLAVNKSTREITLQRPDGASIKVVAGPAIRNFDQIQTGNKLNARYVVSLNARRLAADEVTQSPAVGVVAARAKVGEAPAGAIGAGATMTVVIKSVDIKQHIVVFTDPDGVLQTVQAERDEGKRFIAGLKPGDRVEITYGEALVLAVR